MHFQETSRERRVLLDRFVVSDKRILSATWLTSGSQWRYPERSGWMLLFHNSHRRVYICIYVRFLYTGCLPIHGFAVFCCRKTKAQSLASYSRSELPFAAVFYMCLLNKRVLPRYFSLRHTFNSLSISLLRWHREITVLFKLGIKLYLQKYVFSIVRSFVR